MSSEKRLVLFLVLSLTMMFGMQAAMDYFGLAPKNQPQPPADAAKVEPGVDAAAPAKAPGQPEGEAKADDATKAPISAEKLDTPSEPAVPLARPEELILGSSERSGSNPYRLEVRLTQRGAGVDSVLSSKFEAELAPGRPRNRPLHLIESDPLAPPSLTLAVRRAVAGQPATLTETGDPAPSVTISGAGGATLDGPIWEVVRDEAGKTVRDIRREGANPEGQEIAFRRTFPELDGLVVTRTYRLFAGDDAFEMSLAFENPGAPQLVTYTLLGPHGIPIEGEWYTGTFRDVIFGQVDRGATTVVTRAAYDVVKAQAEPERFQSLPLKFAGVENQYFATFLAPWPAPTGPTDRIDAEAVASVIHSMGNDWQKADVTVELTSRPVEVGPNTPVTHTYKVYAGPKTPEALAPYGAEDLSSYRKGGWFTIPGGAFVARTIISPLLRRIYDLTAAIAGLFGGTQGNYGIAIILLTVTVRLILFPLGRKQAIMAKKMQDLQPLMTEIREKYKDDKERQAKETFALYRKYGVNPAGGCLPALVQLPIFVGLWQALNNSVALRHASFLYIRDLAAPDMLARFPTELPFLGRYFNLLPILVVAVMLVQTRLFSPPAVTEEQKQQQQIMKFMMVFMAFMFYKVPSGLGLYFITSSAWSIGERLLLPKALGSTKLTPRPDDAGPEKGGHDGKGGGGGGRGPAGPIPQGGGWLSRKLEALIEEAQNDKTYRKPDRDGGNGGPAKRDAGTGRDRDKPRGNPRTKPGKRR